MKISSLFQHHQLKPAWTYSAAGILWRIVFSRSNFILGEDRDTEKKEVSFFCLNASNGDVLWKEKTFGEKWWIGIEGVFHDKVFLHGFKKPDMPEHGKIIAIDLGTGKEIWRNTEYAFLYAAENRVVAYRDLFERRLYYELDIATGEFIEEFNDPPYDLYERKEQSHGRNDFLFPRSLTLEEADYPIMKPIFERHGGGETIRGNVEYVRTAGCAVFNYHALKDRMTGKEGEDLQNRLCVVEESGGRQLFEDLINVSTPAPVPDSFFVGDGIVYYVKERRTLTALPLPRPS
ncbi:MAG TPA: DUF4905 domain-containing protein [Bacteroidota bacterium]|nr:DUF4905 domain-containing protein [Bacteroidota bacterium]